MKKILVMVSFGLLLQGSMLSHENMPFSFEELETIPLFETQEAHFLSASDRIPLAYYPFIPAEPTAIVIFYHGAGLYTNTAHQWIAWQLQKEFNIGCYMIDIRGHGHSGGPRGDAPTIAQVWNDIDVFVENIKKHHPYTSLYLAGHSSGSGLLINYNAHGKHTDSIDGYIFLAPYLGPQSDTLKEHQHAEQNFVKKIRPWVYMLNALIPWNLLQHIHAVFFNYPQSIVDKDPLMVTSYSYAMSSATTPYEIKTLLNQLHKPFAIYIGQDDEQFLAEKIVEYKKDNAIAEILPDAKHLSILLQAPELIAKTIWQWRK